MTSLMRSRKGQRGFTLVELMVVVAILAVLMAIIVPAMAGTRAPSVEAQLKSDANGIQKAVTRFDTDSISEAEGGVFPDRALATEYAAEFGSTAIASESVTLTLGVGTLANTPVVQGSVVVTGIAATAYSVDYSANTGTITFKDPATASPVTVAYSYLKPTTTARVNLVIKDKKGVEIPLGTFAGTGGDDRRVGINWGAETEVYSGNRIVSATFVPDFLIRTPDALDLLANESARSSFRVEQVKNALHEFLLVMRVSGSGQENESRTVEVYRLTAAVGATDTASPYADDSATSGVNETVATVTYTQVF